MASHGDFLSALEYRGIKPRTAQDWMSLAAADLKSATVAHLGGLSKTYQHLRHRAAEKRAAEEAAIADKREQERASCPPRPRRAMMAPMDDVTLPAERLERAAELLEGVLERLALKAEVLPPGALRAEVADLRRVRVVLAAAQADG